ncbi:MAG: flavin-dependent oxidoreductase [Pigmentiphaga sp.]
MILISGAGIGGLALALSLEQRGVDFILFEGASELKPLGVGINVLPHAVGELQSLGVVPALEAVSVRTRELRYMNCLGQEILTQPRGMYAGYSLPQLSIHRGKLHGVLLQAMLDRKGGHALRLGHRCEGFRQTENGVTAYFRTSDGNTVEVQGDALVGADGIHSAVRKQLHPNDGGMKWNGVMMWRGTVDWPTFEGGDTMIVSGDMRKKLLYYPVFPGKTPDTMLLNWVLSCEVAPSGATPPSREDWSRPGRLEDVLAYADTFRIPSLDFEALMRKTDTFLEYPMCDRDPLEQWGSGSVTLLGDAAHPMYPVGSNGAAQAIIDGKRLGEYLANHPVKEALAGYETERIPLTSAIVLSNRQGGPERVVDVVSERAPDGFDDISDVITQEELIAIGGSYANIAGFSLSKA